jgi:hypothetical protein
MVKGYTIKSAKGKATWDKVQGKTRHKLLDYSPVEFLGMYFPQK